MKGESVPAEALTVALEQLQRRARSESEIVTCLHKKGFTEEVSEAVVAHLRRRGFLNDEALASQVMIARSGRRIVGDTKIRHELERRGLAPELIEKAFAIRDDSARVEGADESVVTLLASKYDRESLRDRGRAGRFLAGRGFSEDQVESALDRFFGPANEFTE